MIGADQLSSLPHLTPPVLTAYLDTNPANRRNQGRSRGYLTWLKSRGRFIAEGVPRNERALLQQQLRRIFEYLQAHAPRRRGTIIFSGPYSWEFLELQMELRDELQWGKPPQIWRARAAWLRYTALPSLPQRTAPVYSSAKPQSLGHRS